MIQLDRPAIETALPLVAKGLTQYCWLQAALPTTNVASDRTFQTAFNGFYRVRRNREWQTAFYRLLEEQKSRRPPFAEVLEALHITTGKVEASFASKLVASVDPDKPVIDDFVLQNLGLRLLRTGPADRRRARAVEIHDRIGQVFADYLETDIGRHLISRFEQSYPNRQLTRIKMLDLVLWQAR